MITICSLVDYFVNNYSNNNISVYLLPIRVLRITRLIRSFPFSKVIFRTFSYSMVNLINIGNYNYKVLLTLIFLFIFTLLGMNLFGDMNQY